METAIPINHSISSVMDFVADAPVASKDKAISQLALEPGWEVLEEELKAEIERLRNYDYTPGDSVEAYGFKALAASMCVAKLEWIINRVRSTERAVREQA